MRRSSWISVAVLAGVAAWWVAYSWPPGRDSGADLTDSAQRASGQAPTARAPLADSRDANPAAAGEVLPDRSAGSGASSAGDSPPDRRSAEADDAFAGDIAPGSQTPTRRSMGQGESPDVAPTDGVNDPSAPAVGDTFGAPGGSQAPLARNSPSRDAYVDPVDSDPEADAIADEILIDDLARSSLGDDPTLEELNARRGWAATLISGLSPEERAQLQARAAAAADAADTAEAE